MYYLFYKLRKRSDNIAISSRKRLPKNWIVKSPVKYISFKYCLVSFIILEITRFVQCKFETLCQSILLPRTVCWNKKHLQIVNLVKNKLVNHNKYATVSILTDLNIPYIIESIHQFQQERIQLQAGIFFKIIYF